MYDNYQLDLSTFLKYLLINNQLTMSKILPYTVFFENVLADVETVATKQL